MKYVLTGTTGGLGSRVLHHLLRLVPSNEIRISVYNPAGVSAEIQTSGVEICKGDYSVPETLDVAFKGADKLLIISYPGIAHELRVKNHTLAINAAKRCGIGHIYYTSLGFAGDSRAAVMQAHIDTEAYLRQSGMTYTIIREGIYSESFPLYFGYFNPKEGQDEVWIPYSDGGIAWVCRDDLGEGTARVMTSTDYENQTLLLSGSIALTLNDIASYASQFLGRNITLRIVSEDDYVEHNKKQSEELLRSWATTFPALGRGELAHVDPLLRQLLGRDLKPMIDTLKEMLAA